MKKDLVIAIAAILIIAGACYALASIRPDLPLTPSQPFSRVAGAGKGTAKGSAKPGKVIMHVNGEGITEDEFLAYAESAPPEQRAFLVTSPEGRRLLAEEIVKIKALEQEAERLGLADEPQVRTQLDMTRSQILAGRALQKLVQDKVAGSIEGELQKEAGETIALRHILVAYEGGQIPARDGKAPPPERAMQRANELVARIRGGAAFEQVAASESDDRQTATTGGSLGSTRRDALPPEIAAAVSSLKPGQVSDPVRTPYGIHIFRVDAPSMEELRPALAQRAQQQAIQETVERLEKQAKVELDPTFFKPPSPGQTPGAATKPNT